VTLQLSVSEKLIKTRTRCASVHVAGRWWQTRCCSEQIPLFTCRAENRIIISGWLKMQAWRWQTTKKRDRQCKSEWRMGFVESLLSVLISLLRLINLCWEINTLRPVALTVMYSIPFSISFSALLLHFLFMIFVVFRTLLRNGRHVYARYLHTTGKSRSYYKVRVLCKIRDAGANIDDWHWRTTKSTFLTSGIDGRQCWPAVCCGRQFRLISWTLYYCNIHVAWLVADKTRSSLLDSSLSGPTLSAPP